MTDEGAERTGTKEADVRLCLDLLIESNRQLARGDVFMGAIKVAQFAAMAKRAAGRELTEDDLRWIAMAEEEQ